MLKKIKKQNSLKEISGILVPTSDHSINEMSLLSSSGLHYRFLKNSQYRQLKSKVGDCIRVRARLIDVADSPTLDVTSFTNEFGNASILDDFSDSPRYMPEMSFVDYESIFT